MKTKILVTGAAGFIGFHLTTKLIENGFNVVGIDSMNRYYDVTLKYAKLPYWGIFEDEIKNDLIYKSKIYQNFSFAKIDIKNRDTLDELFQTEKFGIVCNLAAQAGVQYSIENPYTYVDNNITGFINIIEAARQNKIEHLLYASSSSVYGDREDVPFKESDKSENPINLYAATKKSNELIAHAYSHLFKLKTTGLRFFTVYGPWGRPDMAPYIFVDKIFKGESINVFGKGNLTRDFTYIDDIIDGISKIIKIKPKYVKKYSIYNIGNSEPVNLKEFISTIEEITQKKAKINYLPLRKGDVKKTFSDVSELKNDFGYSPTTNINEGIKKMIYWYQKYHKKQ